MNKIFQDGFIEIAEHEQTYIAKNIDIEKGIGKNKILLENLFALFSSINAKIPLFITGETGLSKSLSCQLLFEAMKRKNSYLFKSLPQLIINVYQGHWKSSPSGVYAILDKAKLHRSNRIISLVLFDKMGFTDHSPNNPLKLLNYELDNNEKGDKISFVIESNFILDMSKINRGILLSIPIPNEEDIKITAMAIAESYNKKISENNKDLFIALSSSFYEYKEIIEKNYNKNKDFHGIRDFYYLIKKAMIQLMKKVEEDLNLSIDAKTKEEIGISSLESNFSGLELKANNELNITSLEIIKKCFKKRYPNVDPCKQYNILKKINENINDKESRHLLLLIKSSTINYLMKYILSSKEFKKDKNKKFVFYIGSKFSKDIQSDEYNIKILNKIKSKIEQNKILILKDMEDIYINLYDLFDKNFTIINKKKYARITFDEKNEIFSSINDDFKFIILINEKS